VRTQANGVQCFVLTGVVFAATWSLGWFEPAAVYDHFGEILSALNLMSLAFCAFLTVKVRLDRIGFCLATHTWQLRGEGTTS
jgi:hypothetical protein